MSRSSWVIVSRRFLAVVALMFWQGGFTFYAGVVVPIGTHLLGSAKAQGVITQQVSHYLNLSGAIALAILALDFLGTRDEGRIGRAVRSVLLLGMVGFQVALVWLHPQLDALFDPELGAVERGFRPLHRRYLWFCTYQWGCCVGYIILTLIGWRREDRKMSLEEGEKKFRR